MKKKIFTALLICSMFLSVTACGSTKSNDSTVSAKNEVSQKKTEKVFVKGVIFRHVNLR